MTGLPEPEAPHPRGPRITHYLYLMVLIGLLLYLAFIIWQRLMFVEGHGQVQVERVTIASVNGGRIEVIAVKGGQSVKHGEFVAQIAPAETCQPPDSTRLDRLRMDASMTRARIEALEKQLSHRSGRLEKRRLLRRALEIDTRMDDISQDLRDEIIQLQEELALEKARLTVENNQLSAIETQLAHSIVPDTCRPEILHAPRNGRILQVASRSGEVTTRATPLVTMIPELPEVWIEASFDSDELDELALGDTMQIEFTNGRESLGRIVEIRSPQSHIIHPRWKPELPPTEQIRAILHPLDEKAAKRWTDYDRMEVTVTSQKAW